MAGSSNFLIHNPGAVNQETDATYSSDEIRSGGITYGLQLPSVWLNKVWYQCTTMAYAIAQALAAKGYSIADSNPSGIVTALTAMFSNGPKVIAVAYSAAPALDCSQGSLVFPSFEITMTGNIAPTLTNVLPGQLICVTLISSGAYSVTWPSNMIGAGDAPPSLTSTYLFRVGSGSNAYIVSGPTTY